MADPLPEKRAPAVDLFACAKCGKAIDGAPVCFICTPDPGKQHVKPLCDTCWPLEHRHRRRKTEE